MTPGNSTPGNSTPGGEALEGRAPESSGARDGATGSGALRGPRASQAGVAGDGASGNGVAGNGAPGHGVSGGGAAASVRARLASLGAARLARAEVFPLSSAQQRLWLSDQALPGRPAYHLVRHIEIDGDLDAGVLQAALTAIAARHEALRTSVLAVGGQPVQRVAAPAPVALPLAEVAEDAVAGLVTAMAQRPLDLASSGALLNDARLNDARPDNARPDSVRSNSALWRAELLRTGPARHHLVLVFHHIIADAATIALVLTELATAYPAIAAGQPVNLPPAEPYRSYVRWERAFASQPDHERQRQYWRTQLAGSEPLSLPTDRPRPVVPQRPGGLVPVRIPAAAADALREAARANGATLAQAVLAGWAVVLHRFSGRADVVTGLPVDTRHEPGWAHSAGLYVTTLPIRVPVAGNPPFGELLRRVRGTVLAALGATGAPPERAAGVGGAWYDVTFSLVSRREREFSLPGLRTRVTAVHGGRAKFDLHVEIADAGPGQELTGNLEYDAELFTPRTATLLAAGLATLLTGAAATPSRRIGNLPLWPAALSAAPPVDGGEGFSDLAGEAGVAVPGGFDGVGMSPVRVDRLFGEMARERAGQVAVIDAASGMELSYGALAGRAGAVAAMLAAQGVRRGDFVGVALGRSVDMVTAILGVLSAGAAYVPLDVTYPAAQLATMISRAGVRLVLGGPLPGQAVPVLPLPGSTASAGLAPAGFAPAGAAGDDGGNDPAYVMFTSGSTGEPKAVVVPHRAVVRLVRGGGFATMTAAERWLHAAAPAFDAATLELWAPLLNGGTLVVLPGAPDVATVAAAIREHRVTSAFLTTGLFNLVVDTDVEALRPLRELIIGGEAASPGHVRRALGVTGTVVNGYGPTENTTFTTCHPVHSPAEVTGPLPLGRPIGGTEVHIVDGYGHPVPDGVTGEILAGGDGLALGYAGAPGRTAERFVPSPSGPPGSRLYRTGDYGRIGPDGRVWFAGRRDDQVKVRGFRIELGAVEQAVLAHPEVAQAAVVAHTDPSGDRRLIGYLVGRASGSELTRYLAGQLPAYMIPGQWIVLPELPLGPAGKVDRRALPAPDVRQAPARRPATVVEELLAAWYTELLGVAGVTPETDFFAVGGHSLLASRLAARIRAVLAVDVPLATVFGHPRLADLAAAVTALDRTSLPLLRPGAAPAQAPLSPAQERMWFLQRYAPASAQYHVPLAIDLTGDLDEAALTAAFQAVCARHPMLRTVFGERDGQPWQRVLPADTPADLRQADLTGLPAGMVEAAAGQLAAAVFTEPFDLTAAPPVRATLVRMAPRRYRLLFVVHHLAADGWSLPLIYRDLAAAYDGELPPAGELSYGDFAVWQRAVLAGPAADRLAGYWRAQLAGAPARLSLDADLTGPGGPGEAASGGRQAVHPDAGPAGPGGPGEEAPGGIHRMTVPATLAGQVRTTARQAGATPFATLLAAFAALLTRHTGQRDLVVGTPVAGRGDAALADLTGLFVNTLPLRVDASGEPSFDGLVRRVRDTVVAGLEHAGLPFERIVELAGLPRTPGQPPLVQVLFALQPAISRSFTLGPVAAEVRPAHQGTAKFDLTMSLFDGGEDGFTGFLEYRSDRFSPAWAAAFAAEFTELLGQLTGAPDRVAVAAPAAALPAGGPVAPGPASPAAGPAAAPGLAAEVGQLWARVLGGPVHGDTDFFAAGGHSLAAMRVTAELRDRFGRDVPLRDLFDHPTLDAFAARVAAARPASTRPPLRSTPGGGPAPLTAEQERHWVLYQLEPDSPAQNVPMVWRLHGPLDVARLRQALTLVAVRQAVLRTTFEVSGGVPAQRIGPPRPVPLPVEEVAADAVDEALRRAAERPFDLTAAPPWRASLLRLGGDDHYLLVTLHHIICDGWSMPILLTELSACYDGGQDELAPLPVQYADYARWQAGWLRDGYRPGYWSRQLAGVPALELPTDRPRPARPGYRSGEVPIVLPAATASRLEALAAAEGTTLFTVLLGLFATLLGRYSGQRDFAIGTFHANRDDVAVQRLIGYFVNNLALRCDLSGRPSWRALLGRLRTVVTDAHSHTGIPFEQVLRDLRTERDTGQTPLFQAMLVLQNLPPLPSRLGELELTVVRRPYERADFDLTLWFRTEAGGLHGGLIYDADVFTPATADRLAGLFTSLLAACLAGPDAPAVAAARPVPQVTPPAAALTPAASTPAGPTAPVPAELAPADAGPAGDRPVPPLAHRFAAQAAATPAAIALTWITPQGAVAELSYAGLLAAVTSLAAQLRAAGAGPEYRMAVYLPRSAAAVTAFLAVSLAGAAYVPLDPGAPAQRTADLLASAAPDCLLSTGGLAARLPAAGIPVLEFTPPDGRPAGDRPVATPAGEELVREWPWPHPQALAYVIFTSGSTGRPKPVLVTQASLAAYLDSIGPALDLRAGDRVLAFAAPTFDATTEELYPALLSGACVALRPDDVRVPDAAFDALLTALRPTVASLPVTFWHAWVDRLAREAAPVPDGLRMLLLNAEEPSVHRYHQWCAAGGAGVRFVNTYGPTEATVTATLYEPGPAATAHETWDRFPVGTALAGVSAQVLDEAGWPVPDGAVGELCLGGAAVTRGYGGQPGLTAAAFWPDAFATRPGARLYRTGDLARRLADGTLLLLGRADRQVKIRGHRVEPGEVEAVLLSHPAVAQAAVLTTGDGEFRQLVGYVAAAGPEATSGRLRDWLAARLPGYLVPARLPVLPALPLTPHGKVDRRALAARLPADLAAQPDEGTPAAPPATPVQERLHGIWCTVLSRASVGVHDNFFSIGGDSIRGLQIVTQAREAGLELTVRDLFDRQTIAGLAALAETRPPGDGPAADLPGTGLPTTGLPTTGLPTTGLPTTGPPAGPVPARTTGLTDSQLRGALARLRKG